MVKGVKLIYLGVDLHGKIEELRDVYDKGMEDGKLDFEDIQKIANEGVNVVGTLQDVNDEVDDEMHLSN